MPSPPLWCAQAAAAKAAAADAPEDTMTMLRKLFADADKDGAAALDMRGR